MELSGFGVGMIFFGSLSIVFRSAWAEENVKLNRLIFGFSPNPNVYKRYNATMGFLVVVTGIAISCGFINLNKLSPLATQSQYRVLSIVFGVSYVCFSVYVFLSRNRWARFAAERTNSCFGLIPTENQYRTVAIACSVVLFIIGSLGLIGILDIRF